MEEQRDIKSYFNGVLENIDIILENNFYKIENKDNLKDIRKKIDNWYNTYKEKKSLKYIDHKELKYIAFEITELFDKFYEKEDIDKNYTERLSYDFSHLKHYWKDEILGEVKDVR